MQIDAFVFQGPPQALDEDIVDAPPLAVHRDAGSDAFQPICPSEGRELAALVSVHDCGRAEPVDGLVQRLDAEVRFGVFDMRQARTLRVNQSMMATRYRNPRRIGR